jgi:Ca2+-binding EF-hand superfamily protein
MSDGEIDLIRKEFDSFDKDGNGMIDLEEFLDMIATLYPGSNASYIEGGFTLMDENSDGLIDFQEFLGWWRQEDWDA